MSDLGFIRRSALRCRLCGRRMNSAVVHRCGDDANRDRTSYAATMRLAEESAARIAALKEAVVEAAMRYYEVDLTLSAAEEGGGRISIAPLDEAHDAVMACCAVLRAALLEARGAAGGEGAPMSDNRFPTDNPSKTNQT